MHAIEVRADGRMTSHRPFGNVAARPCIFEHVYFSRPDSVMGGHSVYEVRKRIGMELAKEAPVEADLVIPVPDSGVPAAIGLAGVSYILFRGIHLIVDVADGAVTSAVADLALATEALPAAPELKRPEVVADELGQAAIIPNTGRKGGLYQLDGGPLRETVIRFPQFYYVVSGLAAACFVVFVIVRDPGERPARRRHVEARRAFEDHRARVQPEACEWA